MNLKKQLLSIPWPTRITYDVEKHLMFINLEGCKIKFFYFLVFLIERTLGEIKEFFAYVDKKMHEITKNKPGNYFSNG